MRRIAWVVAAVCLCLALSACKKEEQPLTYTCISMSEATVMMREKDNYILLDVRTPEEFAAGHIPGAVNIANETIGDAELPALPNKDQLILVYCRSGNRSKQAAAKLVQLGYRNVVECGGIIDWTGALEGASEP